MRLWHFFGLIWLALFLLLFYFNFIGLNLAPASEKDFSSEPGEYATSAFHDQPQAFGTHSKSANPSTEVVARTWEVKSSQLRAVFTDHPFPQWHRVEHLDTKAEAVLPIKGSPLFELVGKDGLFRKAEVRAGIRDCAVEHAVQSSSRSLQLNLVCGRSVSAEFSVLIPTEAAHYLRISVKIWSVKDGQWPSGGFESLRLYTLNGSMRIDETMNGPDERFDLDPVNGLPILVDNTFFVGVEHPMSVHTTTAGQIGDKLTRKRDICGQVMHVEKRTRPVAASPWQYGAVIGVFAETSQARRAFISYLHAERPGRRSPMVHYNSWYDFFSYQDEGFNGGFKDRFPNPELIAKLRPDKLCEAGCVQRVEAFGKELVEQRHAKIDSFLWDDGWDNTNSLWEFDAERFPNRFDNVAAKAKAFGAGTGVWLSPWGGYGYPQEARVKYGKQHGWETNINEVMEAEAFSLAGPNYKKAFKEVALKFVVEQAVNMFKFDGVAGDPKELAEEMEAMLGMITDLRAAAKSHTSGDSEDDDVWINLTTGTWASPFFLLWADSIWRGGPDIASRPRDWQPDRRALLSGGGLGDGLSRRQRWIRWRAMIVYVLVVTRSHFFPLSQLMIHGVIVASHGDALHWGLDKFDRIDFTQEVWSFLALGLQLQELYVAPRFMTAETWDILAEGLQWARREAHVLRDSHWAFGDPASRDVYCVASWDVASARGFVLLHNPTGTVQMSSIFKFTDVLELPSRQASQDLHVQIVKSAARPESNGSTVPVNIGSPADKDCNSLLLQSDRQEHICKLSASTEVKIRMLPSEVLVLSLQ